MDDRMKKTGLFYVRFMDDWIVLSPNRWKLKKAIQVVNQTLNELKVEKHPDKTFIGRIAKGFDFLGYSFEPKGLSIAPKTLANFLERKTQLHDVQCATVRRIGQYVRNWWRWVRVGVEIRQVSMHNTNIFATTLRCLTLVPPLSPRKNFAMA
jgi:RNA-directed DNA polymerase